MLFVLENFWPRQSSNQLKKLRKFDPWSAHVWLVVSTHLKNIRQIGSSPQVGVKTKKWRPPLSFVFVRWLKHFWRHKPQPHFQFTHQLGNKPVSNRNRKITTALLLSSSRNHHNSNLELTPRKKERMSTLKKRPKNSIKKAWSISSIVVQQVQFFQGTFVFCF